jgi:alanyl-tRNA synthetase
VGARGHVAGAYRDAGRGQFLGSGRRRWSMRTVYRGLFDTGAAHGPSYEETSHFDTKNRYIEIWNAGVFMEYDKRGDRVFAKLPFRSVDTGSGLERMAMVLNGLTSVYETDLLQPLMIFIDRQFAGARATKAARRRIADHLRAATFILAGSVIPSNEGRGYVPRRLIRKCVALVARENVSFDYDGLIDVVIERFGGFYPRLVENRQHIHDAMTEERTDFEQVIERGLRRLDALSCAGRFSFRARMPSPCFPRSGCHSN